MIKRIVVTTLSILCMAIVVFAAFLPTIGGAGTYHFWTDVTDDGKVNVLDLIAVAGDLGTTSTVNKTALLLSVNATYTTLLNRLTLLNSSLIGLQSQVASLETRTGTLETNVSSLKASLQAIQSTIVTVQQNIVTLQGNVTSLKTQLLQLQGRVSTLETNVNTINGQIASINSQLGSINGQIATLNNANSVINTRLNSLNATLVQLAAIVNALPTSGFVSAPAYDSGWINITDKCGQYFNLIHNLNSTDLQVDITGKMTVNGSIHQRYLGLTTPILGWKRTYGGSAGGDDAANCVIKSSEGGLVYAGNKWINNYNNNDAWLVKTDITGNVIWDRTYGGTMSEYGIQVISTSDGGYLLACNTDNGNKNAWLVKTNSTGDQQWQIQYGGSGNDYLASVIQTSDGGYAFSGYSNSYGSSYDAWLVKTFSNGTMQWSRTYGGTHEERGLSVIQTTDGGYALAGHTYSNGDYNPDAWLVKTDSSGYMQWSKTYGGADYDFVTTILKDTSGYVMAGYTMSYGHRNTYDGWLFQTDFAGNVLWSRTYGGPNIDRADTVLKTTDGGYLLSGYTYPNQADAWVVKTDSSGNMQWNRTYGGARVDVLHSIVETADGGYVLSGYTKNTQGGDADAWLVKIDAESGLAQTGLTATNITLYRGDTDIYWNFVRARIWKIKSP